MAYPNVVVIEGIYRDPADSGSVTDLTNFTMRWTNMGAAGSSVGSGTVKSGQATGRAPTLASAGAAMISAGGTLTTLNQYVFGNVQGGGKLRMLLVVS